MQIFLDDGDYKHFVYLLGDIIEEFGIECWNYCLMPNHYHATLRPTQPNLSEAMRRLNSIYAQWWNRRHERVGHVFQGRFKDQVVQREGYLTALCRYIALNPVRANLATRPEDWAWSSYAATSGCAHPRRSLHRLLYSNNSEKARIGSSRRDLWPTSCPTMNATVPAIAFGPMNVS